MPGGLFAFQPDRPFIAATPPPSSIKEKIRKRLRQGVWMSKLFRGIFCESEVIINLWVQRDGERKAEKGDAQIWRPFLKPL